MDKPIIFLGPSLMLEKAKAILDADYKPPAKKGDLLALLGLSDTKRVIGLIDGLFLQDYPPTPIEVYSILVRKNLTVVGGASLGALRAVELEKFGMIGIGKVFELFKNGIIDADDEVAVTFDRSNHKVQSEAMIDIRFNLFIAQRKRIIDADTKRALAKVAKDTYFPFRNYESIIDESIKRFQIFEEQLEAFRNYIRKNKDSLKERDAIRTISYIKCIYRSGLDNSKSP
jgi:TfuA protein